MLTQFSHIIRIPRLFTFVLVLMLALAGSILAYPDRAGAKRITATCSNATSDASTINMAIASSSVGDEIVIDGSCLITRTIKLLGDRSYRGESRTGTVLRQASGANLTAMLASDSYLENSPTTGTPLSVRHLTLDGNRAQNTAATSGLILRSWQTVVEDLQIMGMDGDGIRLTNASANGTKLTNTQVNGRIVGNFIQDSGGHGVSVRDSGNSVTDWELTDNWIADSGLDGVHLENAAGWIVERNHVYGVPRNGIYANRLYGTSISDNYIEGFGETSRAGTWSGIEATVQGDTGSTISGNRVFNLQSPEANTSSTYRYISLSRVNYGSGVVSVTGNVIRGAGTTRGTGLYYDSGGRQLIVTSTGNAVERVYRKRIVRPGVTVSAGY